MKRWTALALAAVLLGASAAAVPAAPPEEAILPVEKYSTPKGKSLGTTYHAQLRQFSEQIYHCAPWVGIRKQGLGFNKPRFAAGDDRYLSVWLEIDQHEDARFAALGQERRQSAMFSRYGVHMLRRMAALEGLQTEPSLEGFGVILSWPKPGTNGKPGVQPVNETLALFVSRAPLLEFLARTLLASELATRAQFTLFDGKRDVGRLPLEIWDDPFMTTFKLKDYQPPTGFRC